MYGPQRNCSYLALKSSNSFFDPILSSIPYLAVPSSLSVVTCHFFNPLFFTKMTSKSPPKFIKLFTVIQLMELNPFCKKKTYVAFTIIKLKFTKSGYFLILSDFLWHKTTIQKFRKIPNIFKIRCINL